MKKLLTLALALMLVLSLAACGGNDTPDPSGSVTTDPSTSQQGQDQQPGSTPEASTDYFYDAFDWAQDWMIPDDGIYTGYEYDDGSGNTVGEVYLRFKVYDITEAQMDQYGEKLTANGCDKLSDSIYTLFKDGSINISWNDYSQDGGYYLITVNPHFADGAEPTGDDNQWGLDDYAAYTGGVPEPEFSYTIFGVINKSLSVNGEGTAEEIAAWKQALLDSGFEATRDDGTTWAVQDASHYIEMNGITNGTAHIYIYMN